jgi:tripartite-type tricarboxylate transporter receptor subunit TctC
MLSVFLRSIFKFNYPTSKSMTNTSLKLALTIMVACVSQASQAQSWPTQPIKIIVPFTAGTGMDTIARAVAPKLSDKLGQPVIVQNMAGASGNIGADVVAKASPDGYTVLMGANTMLMASQLYKNVPFNPSKDFSPVSLAAWGTLMLVSNPKTGIKTVNDLVSQAKARPGYINFGSPGIGTPHHMAMELFKVKTNLFMLTAVRRVTRKTFCQVKLWWAFYPCTLRKALLTLANSMPSLWVVQSAI